MKLFKIPTFTTRQLFLIMILVTLLFANFSNSARQRNTISEFQQVWINGICPALIFIWAFVWAYSRKKSRPPTGRTRTLRYKRFILNTYSMGCFIGLITLLYVNSAVQFGLVDTTFDAAKPFAYLVLGGKIFGMLFGTAVIVWSANGFVKVASPD